MFYSSKKFWLTGSKYVGQNYLFGQDSLYVSINPPVADSTTGWTQAKVASGSYGEMTSSTIPASSVFTTAVKPDTTGLSSTNGDAWSLGPFTGVFLSSSGTWSFQMSIKGNNTSMAGQLKYRIWKGPNANGSSATLLTNGLQSTTLVTLNSVTTRFVTTGSFAPTSSIVFSNEYMFIQCAWAITTAGGANAASTSLGQGSASFLQTGPYEDNTFILFSNDDRPGLK